MDKHCQEEKKGEIFVMQTYWSETVPAYLSDARKSVPVFADIFSAPERMSVDVRVSVFAWFFHLRQVLWKIVQHSNRCKTQQKTSAVGYP